MNELGAESRRQAGEVLRDKHIADFGLVDMKMYNIGGPIL